LKKKKKFCCISWGRRRNFVASKKIGITYYINSWTCMGRYSHARDWQPQKLGSKTLCIPHGFVASEMSHYCIHIHAFKYYWWPYLFNLTYGCELGVFSRYCGKNKSHKRHPCLILRQSLLLFSNHVFKILIYFILN